MYSSYKPGLVESLNINQGLLKLWNPKYVKAWCVWLVDDKLQILRQGNNAIWLTYKTQPTLSVKTERYTKGNFDGIRAYSIRYYVHTHISDGLSHPNAVLVQNYTFFHNVNMVVGNRGRTPALGIWVVKF